MIQRMKSVATSGLSSLYVSKLSEIISRVPLFVLFLLSCVLLYIRHAGCAQLQLCTRMKPARTRFAYFRSATSAGASPMNVEKVPPSRLQPHARCTNAICPIFAFVCAPPTPPECTYFDIISQKNVGISF